jgi:hypothetical protein
MRDGIGGFSCDYFAIRERAFTGQRGRCMFLDITVRRSIDMMGVQTWL